MTAPYPEKDINLLTPIPVPYNPNNFPLPGQTTPPQNIDPNFTYPEIDTALLPGVPGQRGATGPIGPAGITVGPTPPTYTSTLWMDTTAPATPLGLTDLASLISTTSPLTYNPATGVFGITQSLLTVGQSQVTGLVSALAGKAVLTGDQTFTGTQTLIPSAAANKVLIVKGAASQTANLQEWQNSAGTPIVYIVSDGTFTTAAGAVLGVNYSLFPAKTTTSVPIVSRGIASQTADLQQWQDSAGTVLAKVWNNGDITARVLRSTLAARIVTNDPAIQPLVVQGAASQTANLQEWQNSTGTPVAVVDSNGLMRTAQILNLNTFNNSRIKISDTGTVIDSGITTNVVLKVQATNASQTADLVQTQNSAGVVLGGINALAQTYTGSTTPILTQVGGAIQSIATGSNPLVTMASAHGIAAGDLVTLAGTTGSTYNGTFVVATVPATTTFTITSALTAGQAAAGGTVSLPAQASMTARSAGTTGLVVRSATSQSANLLSVQQNDGTEVSRIRSSGQFGTGTLITGVGFALNMNYLSASTTGFLIRGYPNQTEDLVKYQKSDSTQIGGVNANAQTYSGPLPILTAVGGATTATSGDGTTATITLTSASNAAVGDLITVAGVTPTGYNGTFVVTAVSNTSPFTVSYANATTGSQTVAGTVSLPAQASVTARSAGTIPLVVKAASGQAIAAQQWQSSAGVAFASMGQTGDFLANSLRTNTQYLIGFENNSGGALRLAKATASSSSGGTTTAQLQVVAGTNANTLKLVVRSAGAEVTIVDNIPTA